MVDSCGGRLSFPHAGEATATAAHLEVEELALDEAQHEAGLARAHVSQKDLRGAPTTGPASAARPGEAAGIAGRRLPAVRKLPPPGPRLWRTSRRAAGRWAGASASEPAKTHQFRLDRRGRRGCCCCHGKRQNSCAGWIASRRGKAPWVQRPTWRLHLLRTRARLRFNFTIHFFFKRPPSRLLATAATGVSVVTCKATQVRPAARTRQRTCSGTHPEHRCAKSDGSLVSVGVVVLRAGIRGTSVPGCDMGPPTALTSSASAASTPENGAAAGAGGASAAAAAPEPQAGHTPGGVAGPDLPCIACDNSLMIASASSSWASFSASLCLRPS